MLALLRATFPEPTSGVGIGDDAAIVPGAGLADGEALVCTVDAQVEGVHFWREWIDLADIGYRATMAAASDLAAMGARPTFAVSALGLPRGFSEAELLALFRGQREACAELGAAIRGGNVSRGPVLSVTTTWLGAVTTPILRGGGKPGDGVWVAGPLGLARAGLLAFQRSQRGVGLTPAIDAFRRPSARIEDAIVAAEVATAGMDVSDGLATDLARLADASGVGATIDEVALRAHGGEVLAAAAAALGEDALALAVEGGEDYALLVTSPVPIAGFSRIGTLVPSGGLRLARADGSEVGIDSRIGFDHLR